MIEIVNHQRRHRINAKRWREFAGRTLEAIDRQDHGVTIAFVSDTAIRKLNRQFRKKDYATDVLSFPIHAEAFETNQQLLGEIVISVDRATAQSKENGLSFTNEVEQLILHGLLHLCGYDHESDDGEMNLLELKLRKKLGI